MFIFPSSVVAKWLEAVVNHISVLHYCAFNAVFEETSAVAAACSRPPACLNNLQKEKKFTTFYKVAHYLSERGHGSNIFTRREADIKL